MPHLVRAAAVPVSTLRHLLISRGSVLGALLVPLDNNATAVVEAPKLDVFVLSDKAVCAAHERNIDRYLTAVNLKRESLRAVRYLTPQ